MKSPFAIINYWILFAAVFFATGLAILPHLDYTRLPSNAGINSLLYFDNSLESIEDAEYDAVIVGPSYAQYLEHFGGFYNLGVAGGYPSEFHEIVKSLPQDIHVYYIITVRDWLYVDEPPRKDVIDKWQRKATLLKRVLPHLHNYYSDISDKPYHPMFYKERTDRQIKNLSICKLHDTRIFEQIAESHPNITFVLAPIRPSDNPIIARRTANLKRMLCAKNLNIIDFSNSLPASAFADLLHLKESHIMLLRQIMYASRT